MDRVLNNAGISNTPVNNSMIISYWIQRRVPLLQTDKHLLLSQGLMVM